MALFYWKLHNASSYKLIIILVNLTSNMILTTSKVGCVSFVNLKLKLQKLVFLTLRGNFAVG